MVLYKKFLQLFMNCLIKDLLFQRQALQFVNGFESFKFLIFDFNYTKLCAALWRKNFQISIFNEKFCFFFFASSMTIEKGLNLELDLELGLDWECSWDLNHKKGMFLPTIKSWSEQADVSDFQIVDMDG